MSLTLLYLLTVLGIEMLRGTPPGEESLSSTQVVVLELLPLLTTMLGGFVAARMAKVLPVQHGIAVGVGALVVGLVVGWIAASPQFPTLYHGALSGAGIVAGASGGYLAGQEEGSRPLFK